MKFYRPWHEEALIHQAKRLPDWALVVLAVGVILWLGGRQVVRAVAAFRVRRMRAYVAGAFSDDPTIRVSGIYNKRGAP